MNRGVLASAATILALLLGAGAAAAQTANASPARSDSIIVRALASGGWQALPLRGARVRALEGGEVIARGRVGSQGMAVLRSRGARPSNLRIVVSGGKIGKHRFRGRISTAVRGYRWPQTIHVDFVTTLADRFHRAHPRSSVAVAKRRTKRFLVLPRSYVIGLDGRTNVAFDGRRFLAAAGTGRHFGRFLAQIGRGMDRPRARRSFRHLWYSRSSSRRAVSSSLTPSGLANVAKQILSGKGIFKLLEEGASLSGFAKIVLSLAGGEQQSKLAAEIHQIEAELQQVEQSLAVVQTSVDDLEEENRESAYSALAAEVEDVQTGVVSGEDTLHSAAALSLQEGCAGTSPGAHCGEVSGLLNGPGGFVSNIFQAGLGTPGAVNSYAEHIAGDALKGAPPLTRGLIQAASAILTDGHQQVFFDPSESRRLRAVAAYWVASYTEAIALAASDWALEGANPATLTNDSNQVTTYANGFSALIPEELPPGTSVNMPTGQMLPTALSARLNGTSTWEELSSARWSYSSATGKWEAAGVYPLAGMFGKKTGSLPFSDWRVAGLAQIEALLESVTPAGGQTRGEATLEQAGIAKGAIAPAWGAKGQRGLEVEYVKANRGEEGCEGSKSTCYWPITIGYGSEVGGLRVADFNNLGSSWEYREGTFAVSDPFDLEWYGSPLWGYAHNGVIYGNASPYDVPILIYRQVRSGECFYYPAPGNPAAGSPGCKGG